MRRTKEKYLSARAVVTTIIAVGLAVSARPVAAQQYLYNVAYLTAGNAPAGVIAKDLNHDGLVDLAVTNFADNTVSVFLGAPGGNFSAKINYITGNSPAALLAADLRGNGKQDLAIVNENAGSVSVLLANGDGTFQSHVDYAVGIIPVGVAAGDFNSDGKFDLAVVNENDNTVSILLGNGDGTFQSQILVPVGTGPTSLAAGDFNGDGKIDLVASCVGSGVVSVLLSNGNGTFTRVDSPSGVFSPDTSLVVVGDFNKDKKLDVVVSSKVFQQLYLLLGQGNGSFQSPTTLPAAPFNPIEALIAADFNHDGKLDVASCGLTSLSGVVVTLGKGDGTFQEPLISPSGPLTSLAAADVNGDGRLDLVATTQITNSVGLFLGNGRGTFAVPPNVNLGQTQYFPDATAAADFDGDGQMDLAVAELNFPNGQISVVLGKGNGKFGKPMNSPLSGQAINNQDFLRVGDFNGDGRADLLIMGDYAKGFGVLMGNGNGTFQGEVDTAYNNGILSIAVGDLNGDGKSDVVLTTNGGGGNPAINIYLSTGDGTFTTGAQYSAPFYSSIATADVNQDGKLDLVVTSFGQPLMVMLGNGNGTFQKAISGPTAMYNTGTLVQDLDGDGIPDIVAGTYGGIAFLKGIGNGSFRSPVYSNSSTAFCCQLSSGDVNGDGKLDLINVTNQYVGIFVMLGNGDGTFRSPLAYSANGQVTTGNVVVEDFNSDGVADIGLAIQNVSTGSTLVSLYPSMPTIHMFPTTVNFGSEPVGQTSPPATVQVTNGGNAALSISSLAVTGDFVEQNNCAAELAIGQSCTLQVSFRPSLKGVRTGVVTIKDNGVPSPQRVKLKGTGR